MIIANKPTFFNLEINVKPQTNALVAATHSLASKYTLALLKKQKQDNWRFWCFMSLKF